MKTVASPATHGRNTMGNVVIMTANGFIPFGKGQATFLAKRMLGKNDREFAKEIGELQRLGVIDSEREVTGWICPECSSEFDLNDNIVYIYGENSIQGKA